MDRWTDGQMDQVGGRMHKMWKKERQGRRWREGDKEGGKGEGKVEGGIERRGGREGREGWIETGDIKLLQSPSPPPPATCYHGPGHPGDTVLIRDKETSPRWALLPIEH